MRGDCSGGCSVEDFVLQGCPTMQRLAAVNGLVALVGSETSLVQVRRDRSPLIGGSYPGAATRSPPNKVDPWWREDHMTTFVNCRLNPLRKP